MSKESSRFVSASSFLKEFVLIKKRRTYFTKHISIDVSVLKICQCSLNQCLNIILIGPCVCSDC